MFFLSTPSIRRLFSLRRRRETTIPSGSSFTSLDCSSPTESDGHSIASSASSISPRIRSLLVEIEASCPEFATYADSEYSLSNYDSDYRGSSSYVSDWPHECECKSRSICPIFIQQHIDYLQSHEWRCVPHILTSAYHVSAEEYVYASDALCAPSARLSRAHAEYDWATRRYKSTRLRAPHLQQRLSVAEEKIATAEKILEAANIRRWEKAQLLMEIGRF